MRLTHVKELEILRQDEDVLVAVVPGERGGDLGGRGLAVRVAVLGEDLGVALAGDEVAEDASPVLPTMLLTTSGSWRFISTSVFCIRRT